MQINAHYKEQCSAQSGGTSLGDAAAADVHLARLARRCVNAGKGNQSLFGVEPAHIANFSHKMRAESRADTEHSHYHRIFG